MKKTIIYLFTFCFIVLVSSCKKENSIEKNTTKTSNEKEIIYEGEFIHVDTAAVLKGQNFIYGVKMNTKAKEVIQKVDVLKEDEYDVVNIMVKGRLEKNKNEGWENILTIEKVDKIYKPTSKQETKVLKYSSKQNNQNAENK